MRETFDLLRNERRGRWFFIALAQSSLGTGAGYIALLLVAESRFSSPWAISLVLIADLVPAMLLGPLFGAIADRWSRKWCAIVADVVRAVAFAGIVLVDSFAGTVALAMLAGAGTGLFTPAALAALPSVVDEPRRVPAATSLYGAVGDLGFTVGPAFAALVLLVGGADALLWVNAATFALSGALLLPLRFGVTPAPRGDSARPSLLAETRAGLRATAGMPVVRLVLLGSGAALFCAGLLNIGELFLATDVIGTTEAGFGVLVAFFGLGFIAGSLSGAKGGSPAVLKRRYLTGLAVLGAGLVAIGLTGNLFVGFATFAIGGFGNGQLLVYERLLIQAACPDELFGRVFGIKDSLTAWAFAIAFVVGGAAVSATGPAEVIAAAGVLCLAIAWAVTVLLRRHPVEAFSPPESEAEPAAAASR